MIILLLFLIPFTIYAQDYEIYTNHQMHYTVNLSNIQVGKPFPVSYELSNMQIIDIDSNITVLGDTDILISNISSKSIDLEVTSYALDDYPMPSLLITALDINGDTNLFYTPSFMIPISNPMLSNTNLSLEDIEPIYFVWNHWWTIAILVFLLFVIGFYFLPSFAKSREQKIITPVINPFELVDKKLKNLKVQSKELQEETYKEFFVELSETVREFLSYTVIPMSLELPTRDIISSMKQLELEEEIQEIVSTVLKNTDRAKYAKQIFAQERIDESIEDSFRLVSLIHRKQQREQSDELRKS